MEMLDLLRDQQLLPEACIRITDQALLILQQAQIRAVPRLLYLHKRVHLLLQPEQLILPLTRHTVQSESTHLECTVRQALHP